MKKIVLTTALTAAFTLVAIAAHADCPVDPVTGNAVAQMISPVNGSTLPAGAVTFQWCNANADYFLTVESQPGAHDIFFAVTGGPGGAGVVSVTLGPECNIPTPTSPQTGCIPPNGETIYVTLYTIRQKAIIPPSPFSYVYTAAKSTQAATTTSVGSKNATFSDTSQNIALTATVTAASAMNQGTVTFQLMDGTVVLGSPVTSGVLANGSASVNYVLPEGTAPKSYTIRAAYSGGTNFQASVGTGTLTVGADPAKTLIFNLPPVGGSATTSGVGASPAIGYGQISASAATKPVAIANFAFSPNGVLITEAGVPAATVTTAARMFVDYKTDSNSGLALVNPGSAPIVINVDLKNQGGATVASTTVPLGPRSHTALFVNQLMQNLPNPFLGTLTLTSAGGFAAVNLSAVTNGRGELLYSALPVADLGIPPSGSSRVLSQVVDGGGNPTQIMLMNTSGTTTSVGKVDLFDDHGAPLALDFGDPSGPRSSLNFTIAPDGVAKFATTGKGILRSGYAVVTVSSGTLPVGNGIFQFYRDPELVSQAGVPDSPPTISTRMYVEVASAPLSRDTGVALVNRNATAANLALTLEGLDGSTQVATLTLGPNEHLAKFITQIFAGKVPANFRGVLSVSATQPVSFLTLRMTINERGDTIWSTLPVADLNNPPQGVLILPQVVNGGGYKTQSIVIGTSTGQGAVYINFYDESGTSMPLNTVQ